MIVMTKGKKISIHRSMVILTKQFLEDNSWNLSIYTDYNELLSNLHLYWIMHSAEKEYVWSKGQAENMLSDEFTLEMKQKLHLILEGMYIRFQDSSQV